MNAAVHAPCGLGRRLQAEGEEKVGQDSKTELGEEIVSFKPLEKKEMTYTRSSQGGARSD